MASIASKGIYAVSTLKTNARRMSRAHSTLRCINDESDTSISRQSLRHLPPEFSNSIKSGCKQPLLTSFAIFMKKLNSFFKRNEHFVVLNDSSPLGG